MGCVVPISKHAKAAVPITSYAQLDSSRVAWQPSPGSQQLFLMSGQYPFLVPEVLFDGSRGNGKSEVLIVGFLQHVGKGWGRHWRGIILKQEFKTLEKLKETARSIILRSFPGAKWNEQKSCWKFPAGELLFFGHCKDMRDYDLKYHGSEYSYIGFDELATWKKQDVYDAMRSCLRNAYQPTRRQPNPPPMQMRGTTNPWGAGRAWVFSYFVEGAEPGVPVRHKDGSLWKMRIFGSVFENIFLDKKYIRDVLGKIVDPEKRKAWLLGDWTAISGGIFSPLWTPRITIKPFKIPHTWRIVRTYDYGSSTPYACVWTAEASGEEATLADGSKFCPPKGSLIVFGEEYGTEIDKRTGKQASPDAGLYLSPTEQARRILAKEAWLMDRYTGGRTPEGGAADGQIFNGEEAAKKNGTPSIAQLMRKEGLKWERADKSPGSRQNSAGLMMNYLAATKEQSEKDPHIYIFSDCRWCLQFLPHLPRDPVKLDEVLKGDDDHLWDALAYRLTMRSKQKTRIN